MLKTLKWNSGSTEMPGKKRKSKQFFRALYNLKKQSPRNVRVAALKNFRKFPRVLLWFVLIKRLHHAWFPGNFATFFRRAVLRNTSDGYFWDYLGKPSRRFSVPQRPSSENIRITVQKNSKKFPGKILCLCAFLNFSYQNTLWYIVSCWFSQIFQNSYFKELLRTAVFWRLYVLQKQPPESFCCSVKFEKYLKKTSVGVYIFLILTNKTTQSLMVSWEFCEMF